MRVSINGDTPKSSPLMVFSILKPTISGYPHDYGNPDIFPDKTEPAIGGHPSRALISGQAWGSLEGLPFEAQMFSIWSFHFLNGIRM